MLVQGGGLKRCTFGVNMLSHHLLQQMNIRPEEPTRYEISTDASHFERRCTQIRKFARYFPLIFFLFLRFFHFFLFLFVLLFLLSSPFFIFLLFHLIFMYIFFPFSFTYFFFPFSFFSCFRPCFLFIFFFALFFPFLCFSPLLSFSPILLSRGDSLFCRNINLSVQLTFTVYNFLFRS